MFPKKKRIIDEQLLRAYRGIPCVICGSRTGTVAHHKKTRGSGGDDIKENLLALCGIHHVEIHAIGHDTFMEKYGL